MEPEPGASKVFFYDFGTTVPPGGAEHSRYENVSTDCSSGRKSHF